MDCICRFDGIPEEVEGKITYTGGRSKLRHIKRDTSFGQFIRMMKDICSNKADESYISLKHFVSGFMCDVEDDDDYQAMFSLYEKNPKSPLQLCIVKHSKASNVSLHAQRDTIVSNQQTETTCAGTNPIKPLRRGGDSPRSCVSPQRTLANDVLNMTKSMNQPNVPLPSSSQPRDAEIIQLHRCRSISFNEDDYEEMGNDICKEIHASPSANILFGDEAGANENNGSENIDTEGQSNEDLDTDVGIGDESNEDLDANVNSVGDSNESDDVNIRSQCRNSTTNSSPNPEVIGASNRCTYISQRSSIPDIHTGEFAACTEPCRSRDLEFHVGQLHKSRYELMMELRTHAIRHKFELNHQVTKLDHIICACANKKGCPWRIYAKKVPGISTFQVMTYRDKHTCSRDDEKAGSGQASSEWVAYQMMAYIKEGQEYTPTMITAKIQNKFGVNISRKVAWLAKERCLKQIKGSYEESYQLLTTYSTELKNVDPHAVTVLETKGPESRFLRFFWTYGPTSRAFKNNFLRRMIIIDVTILTGRFRGTLLTAIALDADDCLFPLAFAIVDSENNESLNFFLKQLGDHIVGYDEPFVILSDRLQSMLFSVSYIFPKAVLTYCGHCISHDMPGGLEEIKNKFLAAVTELSQLKFDAYMTSICTLDPRAYKYIQDIGKEHWAELHIPGRRYEIYTTNHIESWNTTIQEARGEPVTCLVEAIRANCSEHLHRRREASKKLTTRLTTTAELQLARQGELGIFLKDIAVSDTVFQVDSERDTNVVDLENRTCTCNWFQVMGLPCAHALKCIAQRKLCMYDFCEHWYTTDTYKETYKEIWQPVRGREYWNVGPTEQRVAPPDYKLHPGRPRKISKRSRGEGVQKQVRRCSHCNGLNHNRKTCDA